MDIITRMASRQSDSNSVCQKWVIRRAIAFVAEELPYCAGVIEDLFLHYEHQVRAFAEWRKTGFTVDVHVSSKAASLDDVDTHFLLLLGDAFFIPSKPGPASTMHEMSSELEAGEDVELQNHRNKGRELRRPDGPQGGDEGDGKAE